MAYEHSSADEWLLTVDFRVSGRCTGCTIDVPDRINSTGWLCAGMWTISNEHRVDRFPRLEWYCSFALPPVSGIDHH